VGEPDFQGVAFAHQSPWAQSVDDWQYLRHTLSAVISLVFPIPVQ
jgi:hypothetical protein